MGKTSERGLEPLIHQLEVAAMAAEYQLAGICPAAVVARAATMPEASGGIQGEERDNECKAVPDRSMKSQALAQVERYADGIEHAANRN